MPYIVTTNEATDITETAARLHGHVYFSAKIESYDVGWSGPDELLVTLTYSVSLMADVSGVEESQFALETDNGPANPDSIAKGAANELELTFESYMLENVDKDLTYTESVTEAERLQCENDEDVVSPDEITVSVPEYGILSTSEQNAVEVGVHDLDWFQVIKEQETPEEENAVEVGVTDITWEDMS